MQKKNPKLTTSSHQTHTKGNVHAHHHKIYVPYAFGAFYNTLAEAFVLDTIGTTVSLMLSGLTIRQTMCFSTVSVLKGVDDHCGYRLPWDPLQWLGEQDTRFHDVHHQSWGIKVCVFCFLFFVFFFLYLDYVEKKGLMRNKKQQSNYSQLYTTFWDHVCGTACDKSEVELAALYEKGRVAAAAVAETTAAADGNANGNANGRGGGCGK